MRWIRTESIVGSVVLGFFLAAALTSVELAQTIQPGAPMHPAPAAPPLVMIDAAHGGNDSGALLNPAVPEKDVTLMFARRLRQELGSRGISATVIRDNDATLSTDQRAALVNAAGPALYLAIHATSLGNGLTIYTSMLPEGSSDRGPFINWRTAQAPSLGRSLWVGQQIAAAIRKDRFPVRMLPAPLRPLNNVTAPALAIEIASADGNILQLASTDYQQMVCAALASALATIAPAIRSSSFQHGTVPSL
jgi:N-acetylmuramoyl-L-alanine amidase